MAFRLIPREERFYDDFVALARQIRRGAGLLEEMLAPDHPVWDKAEEIKEVEHECDTLTHQIIQRLHRTFVTPLDREDIFGLARSLDDVMDAIDATAAIVRLYQIEEVRPDARILSRIIKDSIDQLVTALQALEKKVGRQRAGGRDQPARERGRPCASGRRPPPVRGGARSDRDHQVEGDPGLPRGCDRPLRGRRQRARGRRREARLKTGWTPTFSPSAG